MELKRDVLVVDDNPSDRKFISSVLSEDYNVICAENGKQALEIIARHDRYICTVLLDVAMPVLDGYGVLDELKINSATSSIPVIVVSKETGGHETELRSLKGGANDFIRKPIDAEILKIRVKNLMSAYEIKDVAVSLERDSLTGLYNKEIFYRRISERLEAGDERHYDIAALDVENFKLINDNFGTEEGDRILKYIASLITEYSKEMDGICARRGGDQFLMLIPRGDKSVEKLTERVTKAMENYNPDIRIGVKFGVFHINDDSVSVSRMCDRAVLAVREVKGKYGKNCASYDDAVRQQLLREQKISDEMKKALNEGQFKVFLQPKYNISNDKICGAEALIRWDHPTLGFLAPNNFIPLFEDNGFIAELDMYVFDKTCEVISRWLRDYNKYVPVSVNISRRDIYTPNLAQKLYDTISNYGLKPYHIHLEITETAYTENQDQLINVVKELKSMGFVIEMDDFGSGYSSLNMLSELPIDVLKLDLKFMQCSQGEKTKSRQMSNIISFIISLARWMNLQVVAEGVEIQNQLDMLRGMDCNFAQGYLYAKPLPLDDFTELLAKSEISIPENQKEICAKCSAGKENITDSEKKTMVVIDDMEISRAELSGIFSEEYNIVEFADGGEALAYLIKNTGLVDIIMLDLVMPEPDGFQLLSKLRSDKRFDGVPIMIVSEKSDDSQVRVLNMGADSFIEKPFKPELCRWSVKRVMGFYMQKKELEEMNKG